MPGHILTARCACGFDCMLYPGATMTELHVVAYSADGCDLITIDSKEAKQRSLQVLEDPSLDPEGETGIGAGPWGPYRCPACGQNKLQMGQCGFWD